MHINVIDVNGESHEVPFKGGENLLDLLDDNMLRLRSDCGGLCACVTCHVYISYPYVEILPKPDPEEDLMLTQVEGKTPESRLACELVLNKELDGARVSFAPGSALLNE